MEVTFRSRTLSEVSNSDSVFVVNSILVTSTRCLRHLRAKWGGDRLNIVSFRPIMNWHLLGLSKIFVISCQLMCHLLNRKTTPKERSGFSVLRENHIVILDGRTRSNYRSLFSSASHVETDS